MLLPAELLVSLMRFLLRIHRQRRGRRIQSMRIFQSFELRWFFGCTGSDGVSDGHSRIEFWVADQRDGIRCQLDGGRDRGQSAECGDAVEDAVDDAGEPGRGDLEPGNAVLESFQRHEFADGFSGILSQKTGSSSDTNVLTLTAANNTAIAGTHTVTVASLAQTSSGYLAPDRERIVDS